MMRHTNPTAQPSGKGHPPLGQAPRRPLHLLLMGLAALLALGGVLLWSTWSTPVEARDAVRILVSNVGQGSDDDAETSGNDHAQLFHTAGATNGYVLTSVIVVSEDTQDDDFDVDVCEADTTANQFPTSTCTTLTRPGTEASDFEAGSLEFTHHGLVLSANTNYVVVIRQDGSGSVTLDSTTAAGEDTTGLTGWSIKNKFYWHNGTTWAIKGGGNEALQITVKGHARAANQSATGRPVIYPSAEGAGLLVADVYDIDDPDGSTFTDVSSNEGVGAGFFDFSYQWIRVDGGTETNIGVDSARYQRVDADTGKLIKVEVSFNDAHGWPETVTSLPFGPVAEPAGPSQAPSTLVGNTGQTASATANITQQYAMGFELGDHGQGYEISSVSIDLAAVPSSLTVSLWIGAPPGYIHSTFAEHRLFEFENPSSLRVGLNKFTAPAGAYAYQNVRYWIVLSDFGSSLEVRETTSDAEDEGAETGAFLYNSARVRALGSTGRWESSSSRTTGVGVNEDTPVLRLALEGSRRAIGILASNYAQVQDMQEIVSVGDKVGLPITLGAADRYIIRGFSWLADSTGLRDSVTRLPIPPVHNPLDLRSGPTIDPDNREITDAGTKLFGLTPTSYGSGINVWTAPQGATAAGSGSYLLYEHFDTRPPTTVLTRVFNTSSGANDRPTAPGATLSDGVGEFAGRPLMAFLGEPLYAMVQNLGQADKSYAAADATNPVLSQGFTTGSETGGYGLQGIGVNIEGSDDTNSVAQLPDDATSVSVAVYTADADGKPDAKQFDLISPTEYAAGHSFFEAPPGKTLAASTTYVLVWSHISGTAHRLQKTSSNGEDSGAFGGATVADSFYLGADLANLTEDTRRQCAGNRGVHGHHAHERHRPAGGPGLRGRRRHPGGRHLGHCRRGRDPLFR